MTTVNAFNYLNANNLEDIQMYAGDDTNLTYYVYNSASELLDLGSATCGVNIFRYGDPTEVALELVGTVSASPLIGEFTANIPSASSITMSGVYTQQPTVIDYTGEKHIPGQGRIFVFPSPNV